MQEPYCTLIHSPLHLDLQRSSEILYTTRHTLKQTNSAHKIPAPAGFDLNTKALSFPLMQRSVQDAVNSWKIGAHHRAQTPFCSPKQPRTIRHHHVRALQQVCNADESRKAYCFANAEIEQRKGMRPSDTRIVEHAHSPAHEASRDPLMQHRHAGHDALSRNHRRARTS